MTHSRAGVLLASGLLVLAALTACGSSSSSNAAVGTKVQQDCTAVADVLSDGPDPDADPIGYAQAQVVPLEQLKVSETNLRSAVKDLAAAYQKVTSATGTAAKSAAAKVSSAGRAVNAICPGAAS